jgi:DNA relaxase NicK
MDKPFLTNGTSNYNPSLTHSQSELDKKKSAKLNSRKSSTAKDRDSLGGNLTRNTRLNCQNISKNATPERFQKVHLDYLQGYTKEIDPRELRYLLANYFKIDLASTKKKPKWIQRNDFSVDDGFLSTAEIYYDTSNTRQELPDRCVCYVRISGELISTLNLKEQHQLCVELFTKFSFVCTRIDIAIDDYSRIIRYEEIIKACEKDNVSGFKTYLVVGGASCGQKTGRLTIYLGSKESDKIVRFYDAMPVHKINVDRLELQLRKEKASVAFQSFIKTNASGDKLASLMFIYFGFYDRKNSKGNRETKLSRCPMLRWWKTFTESTLSSYQ